MKKLLLALAMIPAASSAQRAEPYRGPIIDVHLHAHTDESLAQPAPNPATGQVSPRTAQEHMTRSLELMKKKNVVLGIVSGSSVAAVEPWESAAPNSILKGIGVDDPSEFMKPDELDRLFREKKLDAFGEIAAQYAGYSPSDPAFDAYWAVAEKHGVPVGIHTGGGPPRTPYTCCPKFRLSLGDPLLVEDVLVKYPKLKVYVMHAGGFFPQNALMLMTMYPHVYVDIGALSWTPIAGDMLEPFLREAKRRRMLDRVMFGSDQMRWPEAIELAIDRVNRLDFLTVAEKQDIFYDNAAKFLGLTPEEIARHHRMRSSASRKKVHAHSPVAYMLPVELTIGRRAAIELSQKPQHPRGMLRIATPPELESRAATPRRLPFLLLR
jgi:predicted TIM-barrel fold metal-dependent hydrolase